MADEKTVYVVMSGEYSDRDIERVFSNREAAEKHAADLNVVDYRDSAEVEEHELLDEAPKLVRVLFVHVYPDRWPDREPLWEVVHTRHDEGEPEAKVAQYGPKTLTVYGTDFARVRKVASEKLAELVADREGITPASPADRIRAAANERKTDGRT